MAKTIKKGFDPKNRIVRLLSEKIDNKTKYRVIKPEIGFSKSELSKREAEKQFEYLTISSQNAE